MPLRSFRLRALFALLLVGTFVPCGCAERAPYEPEQNGARLKRLWLTEPMGSRMLAPGAFWDSATQRVCKLDAPYQVCIAHDEQIEEARYIDKECTQVGIALPALLARVTGRCSTTFYETSPAAQQLVVTARYAKVNGGCEVVGGKITVRIATGTRPTFSLRAGPGTGRLRPIVVESSDGLRVVGGALRGDALGPLAFDSLTGEVCTLYRGSCFYSLHPPPAGTIVGGSPSPECDDASLRRSPRQTPVVVTASAGDTYCARQTFYAPPRRPTVLASGQDVPLVASSPPPAPALQGPHVTATPRLALVSPHVDPRVGALAFVDSEDGTSLAPAGVAGVPCRADYIRTPDHHHWCSPEPSGCKDERVVEDNVKLTMSIADD